MPNGVEITPVDQVTGFLPLPILTNPNDFILGRQDYHHHFHPRKSESLGFNDDTIDTTGNAHDEIIEGLAVRYCRGQVMPRWLHDRYHNNFYGPAIPENSRDKFTTVVLACAGIVPRQAIELNAPNEFRVVELSNIQHDFIRRKVMFEGAAKSKGSRKAEIGKYLGGYMINNTLEAVLSDREVRRLVSVFLRPESETQRRLAARVILAYVTDDAVRDLKPIIEKAKEEKLIKHPQRSLVEAVQKFTDNGLDWLYNLLENKVLSVVA